MPVLKTPKGQLTSASDKAAKVLLSMGYTLVESAPEAPKKQTRKKTAAKKKPTTKKGE